MVDVSTVDPQARAVSTRFHRRRSGRAGGRWRMDRTVAVLTLIALAWRGLAKAAEAADRNLVGS